GHDGESTRFPSPASPQRSCGRLSNPGVLIGQQLSQGGHGLVSRRPHLSQGPCCTESHNTTLSIPHGTENGDAQSIVEQGLPVIALASCLLQQPVTDAAMHFRQRQTPAVGSRGKKPHGDVPAGLPVAGAAIPV